MLFHIIGVAIFGLWTAVRDEGGDGIVDFFLPRSSQNSAFETRSNQYTTVSILHGVVWGYKKHYIVCDEQIYYLTREFDFIILQFKNIYMYIYQFNILKVQSHA